MQQPHGSPAHTPTRLHIKFLSMPSAKRFQYRGKVEIRLSLERHAGMPYILRRMHMCALQTRRPSAPTEGCSEAFTPSNKQRPSNNIIQFTAIPGIFFCHPGVIYGLGAVQQNDHLHNKEKPRANARQPRCRTPSILISISKVATMHIDCRSKKCIKKANHASQPFPNLLFFLGKHIRLYCVLRRLS